MAIATHASAPTLDGILGREVASTASGGDTLDSALDLFPHETPVTGSSSSSKTVRSRASADDATSHLHREHKRPERHRPYVVTALTALGGGAVVFLFGFLIGRLTESVVGMPGGVAGLWWFVLPPVVGVVVATLVAVHRVSTAPTG